ncbi:hypothetical protein BOTBODRAFT_171227 [Botryobasidium botryosum FD-172 SS1]|uniref:Uncharacterized protein n=1 Tax=Botryobasidium botryosum (strain FD-172 SS1) TaxID=930990 RepID=A0A067N3Q2_BOTB1|nr:hypothetical protein BOTBODRAFT_171227 [Botryobasidium botryosum FD-172 SS1]
MPSTLVEILAQLNAPARTIPERLSVEDRRRAVFGGGASTEQTKEIAVSKRKAAAAAVAKKAGAKNDIASNENVVKTVEMVQLENKIAAQGDLVRRIKSDTVQGQSLDEALIRKKKPPHLWRALGALTGFKALQSLQSS